MTKLLGITCALFVFLCLGCSTTQTLCKFSLNPDGTCRICDVDPNARKLIEYFNRDTNELRLFVTGVGPDQEILHPKGRVTRFDDQVDKNILKFDPLDETVLVVNGEKFKIMSK